MQRYLNAVTSEVVNFYSENAERTLAVSASDIGLQQGGIVQDNAQGTGTLDAVRLVAEHFKQQKFRGAKRFFVAVAAQYGDASLCRQSDLCGQELLCGQIQSGCLRCEHGCGHISCRTGYNVQRNGRAEPRLGEFNLRQAQWPLGQRLIPTNAGWQITCCWVH